MPNGSIRDDFAYILGTLKDMPALIKELASAVSSIKDSMHDQDKKDLELSNAIAGLSTRVNDLDKKLTSSNEAIAKELKKTCAYGSCPLADKLEQEDIFEKVEETHAFIEKKKDRRKYWTEKIITVVTSMLLTVFSIWMSGLLS